MDASLSAIEFSRDSSSIAFFEEDGDDFISVTNWSQESEVEDIGAHIRDTKDIAEEILEEVEP